MAYAKIKVILKIKMSKNKNVFLFLSFKFLKKIKGKNNGYTRQATARCMRK